MLMFPAILIGLLLLPISLVAQPGSRMPARLARELDRIGRLAGDMEWEKSHKAAERLTKVYPDWPQSWLMLAETEKGLGQEPASERSMQKVILLDSTGFPQAYQWLAWRKFRTGSYYDALRCFDGYQRSRRNHSPLTWNDSLLLCSIRFAIDQGKKTGIVMPEKLPAAINTVHDEYFPSLTVDGSVLVFTRQQTVRLDTLPVNNQEDLYESLYNSGSFTPPEKMPEPVNTGSNEGTQSLSQDGRIMIFTACNRPDSKGGCDLYLSEKAGRSWGKPVNIGYPVNTRYWESTPCLSADGRYLFFSSNRPGGRGQMDIWKSEKTSEGNWTQPVNLGSPVNTPGNEMSPVMPLDSRILYFASDGHPGMGGFDLFRSERGITGNWMQPVNLGFPVNTWADEDGLAFSAYQRQAIIASGRDSLNGKDLFLIPWDMPEELQNLIIAGRVTDQRNGNPVSASVQVQSLADSIISSVVSDPVTGEYLAGIPEGTAFRINATAQGYLPYSGTLIIGEKDTARVVKADLPLQWVDQGASVILYNVFFRWDSYELLPESVPELDQVCQVLSENPGICVEIGGHTDSTGTFDYNITLSYRRAEAVCKYLVSKGINPARLQAKGYGFTNPVSGNLTPVDRAKNRRTELKVLVQ